jgi:hypothetical protein
VAPDAGKQEAPEAMAVVPAGGTAPAPSGQGEETPSAKPASTKGTLMLSATPYATILLNGKSHGDAVGQRTLRLNPGSYELIFQHPKKSETKRFTLEPNGTVRLEFRAPR